MTKQWSPMLVIRPESGSARLEDSESRLTETVNPAALAEQMIGGSAAIGSMAPSEPHLSDPVRADWVAGGWRPSLEYFDWSEEGRVGAIREEPVEEPAEEAVEEPLANTTAADWRWGELAGRAPASERTVGEVLVHRRTARSYDPKGLDQLAFAGILHDFAALLDGTVDTGGFRLGLRFTAIVYGVDGLTPGVWSLGLKNEVATLVRPAELRRVMSDLMCGMQAAETAGATVVLVADFQERQQRFPYERALRELYVEVGRIAQWLILASEARGAGCLITPATNDKVLCDVLGLPPGQAPVYTITFGPRKPVRTVAGQA
ncbi:nitroreductase family protein [Streptomyces sp. NPDC058289]|uniref:nitroreductase family protein n=1 Tax=Streptomyces sp. NPDC058289 TaxID=3346425 RepID=UPI0036EC664A